MSGCLTDKCFCFCMPWSVYIGVFSSKLVIGRLLISHNYLLHLLHRSTSRIFRILRKKIIEDSTSSQLPLFQPKLKTISTPLSTKYTKKLVLLKFNLQDALSRYNRQDWKTWMVIHPHLESQSSFHRIKSRLHLKGQRAGPLDEGKLTLHQPTNRKKVVPFSQLEKGNLDIFLLECERSPNFWPNQFLHLCGARSRDFSPWTDMDGMEFWNE